jgi:hypothetical protein
MNSDSLCLLEILQRQKSQLQQRSNALTGRLEEDFEYLRHNIVFLLGEGAVFAVASKMPPFVQGLMKGLIRGGSVKEFSGELEKSKITVMLKLLMEGAVNIVPFFLKGKKGFVAAFLLKQLKRAFF